MSTLTILDRFEATFAPSRTDDLAPGAGGWIGWRGVWQACWVIEEGQFAGEWACAPRADRDDSLPPFAWAPESDLRREANWSGASATIARAAGRTVGGFDSPPCALCADETPCGCGDTAGCRCTCGRCLYPFPLPDDGPLGETR